MSPSKPSNTDEETGALAGVPVPSSRSTAGPTAVILPFRKAMPAAFAGFEDEQADLDCWEPIGLLAVRVTGQFAKPRIHVEMSAPEDRWEEEQGPPGL